MLFVVAAFEVSSTKTGKHKQYIGSLIELLNMEKGSDSYEQGVAPPPDSLVRSGLGGGGRRKGRELESPSQDSGQNLMVKGQPRDWAKDRTSIR